MGGPPIADRRSPFVPPIDLLPRLGDQKPNLFPLAKVDRTTETISS